MLTEIIQNMRGRGYYRAAKDDNGSKKMVDFKKNRKYISNELFTMKQSKCTKQFVEMHLTI